MNLKSLILSSILIITILSKFSFSQSNINEEKQDTQTYKIDTNTTFIYEKPKPFQFIKYGLKDNGTLGGMAFKKENLKHLGWITASTLFFIYYDQELLDEAQRFGRRIKLGNHNFLKTYISFKGYPIFQGL